MKEKVIAILSNNDALRQPDRAAHVEYLNSIFTKAESYDALAARVAELEASHAKLIAALQPKA